VNRAKRILEISKETGALTFGEFQLSAGGTSKYYFDGRLLTLDPEGAYMVAKVFLEILEAYSVDAIAGPTIGADPIVSAVSVLSYMEGTPISGLIVRKEPKAHGGGKTIEGPIKSGQRVAIVDDTCTTGKSLFQAMQAVQDEGCEIPIVLSILDRRAGGSDEVRLMGYEFKSLLVADEVGNVNLS